MLFNSIDFLIFYPIALLFYFALPQKIKWVWLLVCSTYFYMNWNAKYIILIWFSIVVTYLGSLLITKIKKNKKNDRKKNKKQALTVLTVVILINLAVFFVFKYYNFFLSSMSGIGLDLHLPVLRYALPVGISFYTFQSLGYIIDVFRGTVKAERNLFKYGLFVSFFPQLVAGPIERTSTLLPPLTQDHKLNYNDMRAGLTLMAWGFFQKLVIADRLAIAVNNIYKESNDVSGVYLFVASIMFTVQVYCDFASYSNIAIGASQVMGIKLMKNFNSPYLSKSIPEFWNKWHISLSSWFKDYIFYPYVIKCKNKKIGAYLGLVLVFVISGFWHGAAWTFVIWGILHASYQVIGKLTKSSRIKLYHSLKINTDSKIFGFGQIFTTFMLVNFSNIFFRADSLDQVKTIVASIFTDFNIETLFDFSLLKYGLNSSEIFVLLIAIAILIFVDIFSQKMDIREKLTTYPIYIRWTVYIFLIMSVVIFGVYGPSYDSTPFIYFQF